MLPSAGLASKTSRVHVALAGGGVKVRDSEKAPRPGARLSAVVKLWATTSPSGSRRRRLTVPWLVLASPRTRRRSPAMAVFGRGWLSVIGARRTDGSIVAGPVTA